MSIPAPMSTQFTASDNPEKRIESLRCDFRLLKHVAPEQFPLLARARYPDLLESPAGMNMIGLSLAAAREFSAARRYVAAARIAAQGTSLEAPYTNNQAVIELSCGDTKQAMQYVDQALSIRSDFGSIQHTHIEVACAMRDMSSVNAAIRGMRDSYVTWESDVSLVSALLLDDELLFAHAADEWECVTEIIRS